MDCLNCLRVLPCIAGIVVPHVRDHTRLERCDRLVKGLAAFRAIIYLGSLKRFFCSAVSFFGVLPAISNHPPSLSRSGPWPWSCSPCRRPRSSWSCPTPSGSWPCRNPVPINWPWCRAAPHWAWPSWTLTITEYALNVLWAESLHNVLDCWHHQLNCRNKSRVHPIPSWASRWRWWRSW